MKTKQCQDEDDCPTPMWCRGKNKCPRAEEHLTAGAATCSRPSTPETSEAWSAVSRTPDGMYDSRIPISEYAYAMADHSRKMESQRDALAFLAESFVQYADGRGDDEIARDVRARVREIYSANVDPIHPESKPQDHEQPERYPEA